jgi:outer membrane protein assembly factor BamB
MRRLAGAIVGVLLLCVPAGAAAADRPCSEKKPAGGEWPVYGGDAASTRNQPAETGLTAARAATLEPAWVFSSAALGDTSGAFNSTPIVAGGCVFAGSASGRVFAVDADTGELVWQHAFDVPAAGLGGAIVGAPTVVGGKVIVLISELDRPYAAALDQHTGELLWRSPAVGHGAGFYTNASAAVFNGILFYGFSPAEGESGSQGGWALIDVADGHIVKQVDTIPPADQARGYAGGGIWTTPAFDKRTGYAYFGSGNPYSKTVEHEYVNAILKVDLDRSRPTFGEVVDSYKGNIDQYTEALEALSHTPACEASDTDVFTWPLDDPACGQLDLDFGASPNLYRDATGRLLVASLQKSGVVHVANAADMSPAWHAMVGGTCQACNAASTAFDGVAVVGTGTPGGAQFSLDGTTGVARWTAPVADGAHYESTSAAVGVVYTLDGNGFLDAWDSSTGAVVLKRQMATDVGGPIASLSSNGVAIARHTVYAAATAGPNASGGYLIAYRPAG